MFSTKFNINLSSKESFIIKINNPWRVKWDIIVMILAIWNSATTPIEIAFKPAMFE